MIVDKRKKEDIKREGGIQWREEKYNKKKNTPRIEGDEKIDEFKGGGLNEFKGEGLNESKGEGLDGFKGKGLNEFKGDGSVDQGRVKELEVKF